MTNNRAVPLVRTRVAGLFVVGLFAVLALTSCHGGNEVAHAYTPATGGSAEQGKADIVKFGCGSCHSIPGVRGASGRVAPPLDFFATRTFIGGEVPNTPENLIRWIQDPESIEPKTAMPVLGVSPQQAQDIAAYLYTLK